MITNSIDSVPTSVVKQFQKDFKDSSIVCSLKNPQNKNENREKCLHKMHMRLDGSINLA